MRDTAAAQVRRDTVPACALPRLLDTSRDGAFFMPHLPTRALLLAAALCACAPAAAQDPATPPRDTAAAPLEGALPEVRVEARRAARGEAAAFVTRLGAAELDAALAPSVAEALEARSGLVIRRYGPGGLATASLRGTSAAQTLVLLDGLRLADPQTGSADLSLLPTFLLGGASVSHGAASAGEGGGAVGGVVRLATPRAAPGLRLAAAAGAYGERSGGAMASGSAGERVRWLVAAEARGAEDAFPYQRGVQLSSTERRDGADRVVATAFARARLAPSAAGAAESSAALWLTHAERGLPGPGNAAPTGARQWDDAARLWLTHERSSGQGRLALRAAGSLARLRFRNPGARVEGGVLDVTSRTRSATLTAELRRDFGSASTRAFAEAGADGADLRGGVGQQRAAAGASASLRRGPLTLSPALRLDAQRSTAHEGSEGVVAVSPRVGAELRAARRLTLRASAGRAFRAPTLSERYAVPGGTPGLRPERGWSVDAGASLALVRPTATRFLTLDTGVYHSRLRDAIVWQPSYVSPGVQIWRARGVGRTRTSGLELALRGQAKPATRLHIGGSLVYAWTRAEDRSDPTAVTFGERLRYVPAAHLAASADATLRLRRLAWSVGGAARLVGQRPLTSDGTQHLGPYRVLDLHTSLRLRFGARALRATLAVLNTLDARYEIIRLYPMPPRHARITLDLTL